MITQQVNQWMDLTMEGVLNRKRYRCVFKNLRIGSKEYSVLDTELAQERATHFLALAIALMNQGPLHPVNQALMNEYLLIACDFGCKDAPFLLASRVLKSEAVLPYSPEEVIVFLKLAAERGHAEAAYELACCHAGMGKFVSTEHSLKQYFSDICAQERARLAEYYFHLAVEKEHQDAIEELILAYAYGRGYIAKSLDKFVELCEKLVNRHHQSVTLGYAAWLLGITVEGHEPLGEAIRLPKNVNKAVDYLLQASRGESVELAQHALHLICVGFLRALWDINQNEKFVKKLLKETNQGNQLLALYFAWYSIPEKQRIPAPAWLSRYPLPTLESFITPSEEKAMQFLDAAFFGHHATISQLAKALLQETFGRYFMDDEEMASLEESYQSE